MFTFGYCVDGPEAERLRATEFERHGRHIMSIVDKMTFGAPLSETDVDSVAGERGIVSSLICYETDSAASAAALLKNDPYFQCGAWSVLEFYGCPSLRRGEPPQAGTAAGARYYLALRRSDGAGAEVDDAADLDRVAGRLPGGAFLSGLLQWQGVASNGACEVAPLRAICVFSAADLAEAKAKFAAALGDAGAAERWSTLRIPKLSGTWSGVSPGAVIGEQLARSK